MNALIKVDRYEDKNNMSKSASKINKLMQTAKENLKDNHEKATHYGKLVGSVGGAIVGGGRAFSKHKKDKESGESRVKSTAKGALKGALVGGAAGGLADSHANFRYNDGLVEGDTSGFKRGRKSGKKAGAAAAKSKAKLKAIRKRIRNRKHSGQ